jgi:hypothetical protein
MTSSLSASKMSIHGVMACQPAFQGCSPRRLVAVKKSSNIRSTSRRKLTNGSEYESRLASDWFVSRQGMSDPRFILCLHGVGARAAIVVTVRLSSARDRSSIQAAVLLTVSIRAWGWPLPISIRRGFSASGSSRLRSTTSRPLSILAPVTTM